jgi:hypothetical protein
LKIKSQEICRLLGGIEVKLTRVREDSSQQNQVVGPVYYVVLAALVVSAVLQVTQASTRGCYRSLDLYVSSCWCFFP